MNGFDDDARVIPADSGIHPPWPVRPVSADHLVFLAETRSGRAMRPLACCWRSTSDVTPAGPASPVTQGGIVGTADDLGRPRTAPGI